MNRVMKRWIGIGLCVILCILPVGCGTTDKEPIPKEQSSISSEVSTTQTSEVQKRGLMRLEFPGFVDVVVQEEDLVQGFWKDATFTIVRHDVDWPGSNEDAVKVLMATFQGQGNIFNVHSPMDGVVFGQGSISDGTPMYVMFTEAGVALIVASSDPDLLGRIMETCYDEIGLVLSGL